MTLIRSISGIRGIIGGKPGKGLSPMDIVKYTASYTQFLINAHRGEKLKIVIGRDARVSGEMVDYIVTGTVMGMGVDVVEIGLSTTPTVEMAVTNICAHGGIILTASHNPGEWNALKLLNHKGEFISAAEGQEVLRIAEEQDYVFAKADTIGSFTYDDGQLIEHIEKIMELDLVDGEAIRKANFKVAVDAVNSTGGIAIPALLKRLGVSEIVEVYCTPNGHFPHNPEPLPENLADISKVVISEKADVAFVVDPDVDRLAIVTEKGEMFGEEYTLVSIADYILENNKGPAVSNLSSTKALRDICEKHKVPYFASAVGEVNVVEKMKAEKAIIGGEGNGGVIYPELHYGRDALVGIALFLSLLVKRNIPCSELRKSYPDYHISKNKISLAEGMNVDRILWKMQEKYKDSKVITIDGVKIEFENEWVHLRKSNTENIIRIYAESKDAPSANKLAANIIKEIEEIIK